MLCAKLKSSHFAHSSKQIEVYSPKANTKSLLTVCLPPLRNKLQPPLPLEFAYRQVNSNFLYHWSLLTEKLTLILFFHWSLLTVKQTPIFSTIGVYHHREANSNLFYHWSLLTRKVNSNNLYHWSLLTEKQTPTFSTIALGLGASFISLEKSLISLEPTCG